MGAVGRAVEPSALDLGVQDPRVLTGREVRLRAKAAREQIARVPEIGFGQPVADRGPRLLGDLELDRPPGLLLEFPLEYRREAFQGQANFNPDSVTR